MTETSRSYHPSIRGLHARRSTLFPLFFFLLLGPLLVAEGARAGEGAVKIQSVTPYHDVTLIATNIIDECTDLGSKLATFTAEYASEEGVQTELVEKVDPAASGRNLVVQITNAISGGNAFIGHRKSMSAKAELFENGESKGYVNFTRDSGGGFGAGYKGSCSVLGRCAKALGRDIAGWLKDQ